MYDLLFLIFINIMFFFIGFPITRLLPGNIFKMRILLSTIFGLCISAILVTLLYRYGLSINHIYKFFVILSILLNLLFLVKLIRKIIIEKKEFFRSNKILFILSIIWIFGSLILIMPRIVGGDQFAIFQGNRYDNFTYLNSALVYSKESYTSIINSNAFLQNPLLFLPKVSLSARPSVHILYAFVSHIFPSISYKLNYTFLVFFFSQIILVFMFIIINIIKKTFSIIIGLASLAFSLGFWGQYILDINAWSQISSIPIMLLIIGLIIILFGKEYDEVKIYFPFIKIVFIFSLLFSCSLYLYPENFLFHLPLIFIICLFYFILKYKKKEEWNLIFLIFIGIFFGILSGFLFYDGIIKFIIEQLKFSISENIGWWKGFQAFFLGRDNKNDVIFLNNVIDFISGLFGLYFITPGKNYNFFLSLLSRLLLAGFITYILYYLLFFVKNLLGYNNIKEAKLINKKYIVLIIIALILFGYNLINNLFSNIRSAKFAKNVCITINMSENNKLDDIFVYRISPKSQIENIIKYYNHWILDGKYFKNIAIRIPKNKINNIKDVKVKIGRKIFIFTKEEFLSKWEIFKLKGKEYNSENYLTYKSPAEISLTRSLIRKFSSIINWPGDITLLIKSISVKNLIVILLTIFAIIFSIIFSNKIIMSSNFEFLKNKNSLISLLIFYAAGFFINFLLLIKGNLWGAGKALSYLSPYMILLIVLPLFFISKKKYLYIIISPVFIFIVLQISFGILRIYCSTNEDGIYYKSPYPANSGTNLKKNINWNIDRIYPYIKDAKLIEVDIKNRWLENYIFFYLYVKNKNYYSVNIINSHFGKGIDFGYQKPGVSPDLLITQNKNKLIIKSLIQDLIIYSD